MTDSRKYRKKKHTFRVLKHFMPFRIYYYISTKERRKFNVIIKIKYMKQ